MPNARKNATDTHRGRPFEPGNPGRPKGARNRATVAVETLIEGEAEKLARKAVALALDGDTVALRLCLERIAPVRKGRPVVLELPKIEGAADVLAALSAVIAAVGEGRLTPEEGAAVAGVLEGGRKTIELVEIERRLVALEQKKGK